MDCNTIVGSGLVAKLDVLHCIHSSISISMVNLMNFTVQRSPFKLEIVETNFELGESPWVHSSALVGALTERETLGVEARPRATEEHIQFHV